jgi:DNA-binding response OmpR family regulator
MAEIATRVLVVDDERFFREAIRDALVDAAIPCEVACDAEDALSAAANPAVGAVVLDLGLPGESGVALLEALVADRPALRVIVLSTQAEQEDALEAMRLGACDYLAKPLHDEELVLAVQRALHGFGLQTDWEALRQRVDGLESAMAELAAGAFAASDLERTAALAERAAHSVADVIGASKTSVMLLDADTGELSVAAAVGSQLPPEEMDGGVVSEGVAGLAVAGGGAFRIDDIDSDERFAGRVLRDHYRTSSFAVAPIPGPDGGAGRVLGVICATDREDDATFTDEDLGLLRILALQLGALLTPPPADARAVAAVSGSDGPRDESEETLSAGSVDPELLDQDSYDQDSFDSDSLDPDALDPDAELAREICDAITSEIEPERIFEVALQAVGRALPASPVAVYLIDNLSGELVCEGQWGEVGDTDRPTLPRQHGLAASVLQTGWLVATDAPESDPRYDAAVDTPEDGRPAPLLCVPLRLRGKTLGVLRAFPREGASASARTAEILGAALSAAVRNVLLYRSLLESIDEVAEARREGRS